MSDYVRHGRKPLHPMSNRSADQLWLQAIAVPRELSESAVLKRLVIAAPLVWRWRAMPGCLPSNRSAHALVSMSGCGAAITHYFANALTAVEWRRRPTSRCGSHSPACSVASARSRARRAENAVGALGAVGRNLTQVARVAQQTGRVEGLTMADLRAMLWPFEGLRAYFKGFD
jgi:hypothetical protein